MLCSFQSLEFLQSVVSRFDVGIDKVRVGLISYSSSARVNFYLNKYSNKSDVLHAIKSAVKKGGSTDTAEGLDMARTELFTSEHGMRYIERLASIYENITSIIATRIHYLQ